MKSASITKTARTVIVAPHPDDEWISCGCTMLKKLDLGEKVLVLIITREPRTERRIRVSQNLAKKHKYSLKILGEPEKNINVRKLESFLNKNIKKEDVVYIPDIDTHPDHRLISKICQKIIKNKTIQYCGYNVSLNLFTKIKNKILQLIYKRGFSSFRKGKEDRKFKYRLNTKNKNILLFKEYPRDADVLREIN